MLLPPMEGETSWSGISSCQWRGMEGSEADYEYKVSTQGFSCSLQLMMYNQLSSDGSAMCGVCTIDSLTIGHAI